MRVMDAQKIYPKVILIENEPAKYRTVTEKIFTILACYTDRMEPYSIDEAFLDLTGWVNSFMKASLIAQEIKHRIQTEVGGWLKCSIGISWTRYLAKLASDVTQKNSILIISPENIDSVLRELHLTEAWGIKERTAYHLNQLGIFNLNDLKNYPVTNLMQAFGLPGYYLWANVNGIELEGVKTPEQLKPKSFGHSYSLPKKTTDLIYLRSILMKLCEKTGRRLRGAGMEAKNIEALLTYIHGGARCKIIKTPKPLFDTLEIFKQADAILFSAPLHDQVRLIAVRVTNIVPASGQLSFFENTTKLKKIALAMDKINNRFGDFTIISGQMFGMKNYAQDRIGFRKVEL